MRSLDAHGSVQKKKMKLLEITGNEKIKQEQCILPLEFVAILTQGILNLDLAANVPRQPYSTRPLSKNFFFCFTVTKVWSKSILLPTPRRAEFVSFLRWPHFHKLTELFLARWLANFYQYEEDRQKILISVRRKTHLIQIPVYNGQFLKFTL